MEENTDPLSMLDSGLMQKNFMNWHSLRRRPAASVPLFLLAWFDGKVASWWKPDAIIFVEQLPHTATGKISKLSLREQYGDYLITQQVQT